jgi:hypothetical protein
MQLEAFWPTSLSILAWQGASEFGNEQNKAVQFLCFASGKHFLKEDDSPAGHDTSVRGWPWIGNTHSWVEPTALAVLALKIAGHAENDRVKDGLELLMDRQLRHGGWNYGNTTVFGKELLPMPDSTAIALSALEGLVPRSEIDKSIRYLKTRIDHIRAPFSLGWSILGLSAWGERPGKIEERILGCLDLQKTYGEFKTDLLSLLLISSMAPRGLAEIIQRENAKK